MEGEHSETGSNVDSPRDGNNLMDDFVQDVSQTSDLLSQGSMNGGQDDRISEKIALEKKKQNEYLEEARASLDKFYSDREKLKEQKLLDNKESERLFLEQRDQEAETSSKAWEKVVQLVDLTAKPEQDTTRMKQVMLKLQYQDSK